VRWRTLQFGSDPQGVGGRGLRSCPASVKVTGVGRVTHETAQEGKQLKCVLAHSPRWLPATACATDTSPSWRHVPALLLHRVEDSSAWLSARPWLIPASVLALAGLFQFSSLKDRRLQECRHPGPSLLRHYRRGPGATLELGLRHGLFCLGCCWALMLLMFAVGVVNLTWMAALTALMVYEKTGQLGLPGMRAPRSC
jgi:predicted metal-binding membrane protein